MPVTIRPLHPVFVGEVEGVDCAKPLPPDEVAAVEAGMDQYAVLVFRDHLSNEKDELRANSAYGARQATGFRLHSQPPGPT